jgi:hypothetical protein
MHHAEIDHITLACASLADGIRVIQELLGVSPQPGGKHALMGTHNYLLRLGDSAFLEIIAIDPDAPAPDKPRWFGLDQLNNSTAPFALYWVARTTDIHAAVEASPETLGPVQTVSRNALTWQMTIPADGSMCLHGIAPALIQWEADLHPAFMLPDVGCALLKLEGFHPEAARVEAMLRAIEFHGMFAVAPLPAGQRPYLRAHIQTPQGLRHLRFDAN